MFIKKQFFIIDFDSTFVAVESLDALANIALADNPKRGKLVKQIEAITRLGMEGKISFPDSLEQRLKLFSAHKNHVDQLIIYLHKHVTPSVIRNKEFFHQNAKQIYIISGGFKEYIVPIVDKLGIDENHVLANEFLFDKHGNVTGYNKTNPLAKDKGKIKAIKQLNLIGDIMVIGDGYTDYQIKESGLAKEFFAFTEHVARDAVVKKADQVLKDFDQLLISLA